MGKETKGNRREIVLPGRTRMENADRERGHNSVSGPKCCDIVAQEKGFVLVHCLFVSAGGCFWGIRNGDIGKCEILGDEKNGTVCGASCWAGLDLSRGGKFLKFFFFQRCS